MKKAIFKRILQLLDELEHDGITITSACDMIYQDMKVNRINITYDEIQHLLTFLLQYQSIKQFHLGIDLAPVATIYARSSLHSEIEALASFEMFLKDNNILQIYQDLLKDDQWYSTQQYIELFSEDIFDILSQTSLFELYHHNYRIRLSLRSTLQKIIHEYQERDSFYISSTLLSRFALSIVPDMQKQDYRNKSLDMIHYDYLDEILTVIPKRGIPSNRDVTKALQTFYKDTLFHEFDHECPICNIHFPHMLIASHIKPFRDCAHIYEPIDHNNGLLLCRNHDYLFDQGYFSFDDDGHILLSDELLQHQPNSGFLLPSTYCLPKRYLSKERKAFLTYHRNNIYRK